MAKHSCCTTRWLQKNWTGHGKQEACLAQILPRDPQRWADPQGALEVLDRALRTVRCTADLTQQQRTIRSVRSALTCIARDIAQSASCQSVLGILKLPELESTYRE
jgi:hypothetical protein